jgi:phage shock protein C
VSDRPATRLLRRSGDDRVIAGVCGGLGRYLQVDPVLLRIALVILTVSGGLGVLLYIVAVILIPEQQEGEDLGPAPEARGDLWMYVGVGLIALGSILLVDQLVPWFDRIVGPLVLVAIGIGIVFRGSGR